jgi:hypothetical protein
VCKTVLCGFFNGTGVRPFYLKKHIYIYTKIYVLYKIAYHIEWNHQSGAKVRHGDGQESIRPNRVREILWKLSVPSKVEIFLWRSLHGVVPGRAILASRHMLVPP